MQQELLTSFNYFGKSAIDSAKELVAINGRLLTNTLNSQIKFASLVIEGSEKELGSISSADMKDPQTFFKSQAELFEEYTGLMKEQLGSTAEVAKQASEEFAVWLKESVATGDKTIAEIAKVVPTAPTPAKKVTAKKAAPVKKAAAKPVKKATTKKTPVKKVAAKKAASTAKPVAKKTAAAKKPAAKKVAAAKA